MHSNEFIAHIMIKQAAFLILSGGTVGLSSFEMPYCYEKGALSLSERKWMYLDKVDGC